MTKKSYSESWKTWGLPTARIVEEYPKKALTPSHTPV